jgi:Bacterial protein of unknown function (DUF885)
LHSALTAVAMAAAIGGACTGAGGPGDDDQSTTRSTQYDDLRALFTDWRSFQKPKLTDGIADYSAEAMAAQQRELPTYERRLHAIDPGGWPVNQQVDWQIVRAEMSGLDFDHRVLKPWANNPAFYVTVFPSQSDQPAREGPTAYGSIELWTYSYPLSRDAANQLDAALRTVPRFLQQAKRNLVGNQRDLWTFGTKSVKEQSDTLTSLAERVGDNPDVQPLKTTIQRAKQATDDLASWLDSQAASKSGPSGIGIQNYDWYLKHVQLVPNSWQDQVTLMERELARSHAYLAAEEQRNAALPPLTEVSNAADYEKRFNAAVSEYISFLQNRQIMTIRDYMDPALRARMGRFRPGPREFFAEVSYRDAEIMLTHDYHWFDLAQMKYDPHTNPIRRGPLLYNIFNTRTEGHATGWEELMMGMGMLDSRPRSRELIYILLAERAARALGDLKMHSNEFTLEQASQFASASTPRGWLRLDANTVRNEQHLYLQQPAYGTSYLTGKIQFEALLAARKQQLGDRFSMKRFMDDYNAAGLIPASLLRWELTGQEPPEVARMLAPER